MKLSVKLSLVTMAVASALSLSAANAATGTTTGNLNVTATVSAACSMTIVNVDFGSINAAGPTAFSAPGKVTATCTKTTPYTVSLSTGNSGTNAARSMKGSKTSNTDVLNYNLYKDSAFTTKFGDTSTSSALNLVGTGAAQETNIYASMPAQQLVTPDIYTDNIVVTLAY